eukprot:6730558-Alexandrium_andersonii.AAC.1
MCIRDSLSGTPRAASSNTRGCTGRTRSTRGSRRRAWRWHPPSAAHGSSASKGCNGRADGAFGPP